MCGAWSLDRRCEPTRRRGCVCNVIVCSDLCRYPQTLLFQRFTQLLVYIFTCAQTCVKITTEKSVEKIKKYLFFILFSVSRNLQLVIIAFSGKSVIFHLLFDSLLLRPNCCFQNFFNRFTSSKIFVSFSPHPRQIVSSVSDKPEGSE